jgi:hypothetical protein
MNGNHHHSKVNDIDEMTSSDGDIRSGKSSPDDDSDALNLTSTTPPTSTTRTTTRTSSSPPSLLPFHPSDPCPSGSPTTAAMASVQAALAALQAGQMSLNQVTTVLLYLKLNALNQGRAIILVWLYLFWFLQDTLRSKCQSKKIDWHL